MFKLIITTLATTMVMGAAQASAMSRAFWLDNRSNQEIREVIASNVGARHFLPVDLLGNEIIGAHDSLAIAPFNARGWCRFDFRITFGDGLQEDVYDVNVCEATRVTTYGDGDDGYVRVSYN
jgi:hypothetical protein